MKEKGVEWNTIKKLKTKILCILQQLLFKSDIGILLQTNKNWESLLLMYLSLKKLSRGKKNDTG